MGLFLLVCFVQSVFLAFLLLRFPKNRLTNTLLAFTLLTWGGMCYFRFVLYQDVDYVLKYHYVLKINNLLYLTFFVFPFLYVKYATQDQPHFRIREGLHFIPALLAAFILMPFFLLPAEEKIERILSHLYRDNLLAVIFDYIVIAQGMGYLYFSMKYFKRYHRQIKENYSNIEHLTMYWLRNIIILIFSIWFLGTLGSYLFDSYEVTEFYFDFVFLFIGSSIFFISYTIYSKKDLFACSHALNPEKDRVLSVDTGSEISNDTGPKDKRKTFLDDSYCTGVLEKLTRAMEADKLYLDQNLSLDDVSNAISVSRHHLSTILNQQLMISFFDYVNKYRVEEVKRKLGEDENEKLTLLAVAFDAGFNSKATFNRSFKKHEGLTAQEYRNRLKCERNG